MMFSSGGGGVGGSGTRCSNNKKSNNKTLKWSTSPEITSES